MKFLEKIRKRSNRRNRHHIEKEYRREVSPTDFDTENSKLVKEYLEPDIRQV